MLGFGSQQEVIDRLCTLPDFDRAEIRKYAQSQGALSELPPSAAILYTFHYENDSGRTVSYSLCEDPVGCICINRAYPEDFLPLIDALKDLSPFTILGPRGYIDPESLFYTLDDWIQKNYEEGYRLEYVEPQSSDLED